MAQPSVPLAPPVMRVISFGFDIRSLSLNDNYINQMVVFSFYYNIEPIKNYFTILSTVHAVIEKHRQIGAGPCEKPFERRMVLEMCSRTIFPSAWMGDVEMALRSVSSLVGKPPGVV